MWWTFNKDQRKIRFIWKNETLFYSIVIKDHSKKFFIKDLVGVFEDFTLLKHAIKIKPVFEISIGKDFVLTLVWGPKIIRTKKLSNFLDIAKKYIFSTS